MIRAKSFFFIVGIAAILVAGPSKAALVADQAVTIDSPFPDLRIGIGDGGLSAGYYGVGAETFTVGVAGRLSRVDIPLAVSTAGGGDVTMQILRTTADGSPSILATDILASTTVSASLTPPSATQANQNIPPVVPFIFGADAPIVEPGDKLAIAISPTPGPGNYYWDGQLGSYPGGTAYNGGSNSPTGLPTYWFSLNSLGLSSNGHTLGFEIYVDTPEPGSLTLCGLFLIATGMRCRLPQRREVPLLPEECPAQ